ncbi:CENPB protein Homeodomainlike [Phytophthora megakarya]|uniref:CENPB protein Homeodomainlike n=1 Tax=Phytophthora megakarya TaxID=4795 RepID=A0A225VX48_9STRA|nr:CENPB protein Homeodomainlike [Phytophthora megakarya]
MGRKQKHIDNLTFEQKKKICIWYDDHPFMTQTELAEKAKKEFVLDKQPGQPTILGILKNAHRNKNAKDEDLQSRRTRKVIFPELDEALANRQLDPVLSNPAYPTGWQHLAFSNGWLQAFPRRHGFRSFKAHGESGSVSEQAIPALLETIRGEVKNYALANVYNFDEIGLFYKLCPGRTIASMQIAGAKKSKTRITVALCCNADGSDLREPLFIGHVKKQRFNVDMEKQNRKVLLLIDNASSYSITGMCLSNAKMYFLSPITTSKLQPLDAGIIGALKRRYRRRQLQHALGKEEVGIDRDIYAVDQLLAMKWVKSCWRDIPKDLVLNCFRHTGIVLGRSSSRRSHKEVDSILRGELLSSLERLRVRDPMSVDDFVCNPAEDDTEIETLTREELLNDSTDDLFLSTTSDNTDLDDPVEDEEAAATSTELTTKAKVDAVRSVLFLLPDHPDIEQKLLAGLRTLQIRVRNDLRAETDEALTQTTITSYFQSQN